MIKEEKSAVDVKSSVDKRFSSMLLQRLVYSVDQVSA